MQQPPYAGSVPELKLDQVSVVSGLGHAYLLDQISFSIERPGAKVGIIGASGAGKTTLLRLINRLIEPAKGQVLWQGKPLTHYPAPALRQRIMLVPQEPQLLGMTVAESLVYPLQLQQFTAAQLQQRIEDWQQRLDIPEAWRSRQAQELSAGQRQWISLSRALMAQPQILLLDEPTSALDPSRVERLSHILQDLNCTILLVSHQLSVVQNLCNQVLWLDQGRLRQNETAQATNWSEIQAVFSQKAAVTPEWDEFD